MQSSLRLCKLTPSQTAQPRGFVMVTALIFLMVLSLLGVMAVRGSLFEERFAANDRDLAMARENAELALRDAERDILGLRFDSQPAAPVYCFPAACTNVRPVGTRPQDATDAGSFWSGTNPDVESVARFNGGVGQALSTGIPGVYSARSATACGKPVWSGADWQDGVARTCTGTITTAVPTIPYGTYTDAPALQGVAAQPRYLIELFIARNDLGIDSTKVLFRITAVGFGNTVGTGLTVGTTGARTSVTLQSTFSPR